MCHGSDVRKPANTKIKKEFDVHILLVWFYSSSFKTGLSCPANENPNNTSDRRQLRWPASGKEKQCGRVRRVVMGRVVCLFSHT